MLYIFVEGHDDEQFFSLFERFFGVKQFIQYASMKNEKIKSYIKTINQMPDGDYLFFVDGDGSSIEEKKQTMLSKFNCVDRSKLFVVQYEIESWYYAGITQADYFSKLKMKKFIYRTDSITKEQFVAKLPHRFEKAYMLTRILELYDIEVAANRNDSLKLFYSKIIEPAQNAVF